VKTILIELPSWIGDCVMATPSIENIIKKYQISEIIFLGSRNSLELMGSHPKCSNYIFLDKKFQKKFTTIRSIKPVDIFISYRGSLRTKLLLPFINADRKYQFSKKKYPECHQVEKYNNFIQEALNLKFEPRELKIFNYGQKKIFEKPTLGINPGATYGNAKCWPLNKFVEVALALSDRFDILIFGGKDEVSLAYEIEKELTNSKCKNFLNLSGKTSIKQLVEYLSSLDLFITGDSGPMHIAAAFQIPTISIFGPTKDHETCQWMNPKSIILKKELACQPCMKRVCPLKHHDCMEKITSQEVVASALSLI